MALPASAEYDSSIQAEWSDSVSENQSIKPYETHKLTYTVHAAEELGGNYIFKIKLKHNNSSGYSDAKTGFFIENHSTTVTNPAISSVELSSDKTELIYTLNDPTLLNIELVIRAHAAGNTPSPGVYYKEVVDISADLFDDEETQVAETSVIQAHAAYPNERIQNAFQLVNPTIMPVGANEIDFNYIYYPYGAFNTLAAQGVRVINKGLTLDFSNVTVTINGETKTYEQWLADPQGSPIEFKYTNGDSLDPGHQLAYPAGTALIQWGTRFPFKAVTNEKFINSPQINFAGLTSAGEVQFNFRGGNAVISPVSGEGLFQSISSTISSNVFNGVGTHKTNVNLAPQISLGPYIVANSEQYEGNATHSHLVSQELFRSTITSTERDGTDEVTITYGIPDGVTITDFRIPKSNGNNETQYEKIILIKDGTEYDLGNQGYQLLNHTVGDFEPFEPGEDVVFKFINILKMRSQIGSDRSYNWTYTLQFIGTTNESVTHGTPLEFTAETNEGTAPTLLPVSASNNYNMTAVMPSARSIVRDYNSNEISMVDLGEPFYFYHQMGSPTYPYVSAHRTDPYSAASTGVFSSPVYYFHLPPGVKVFGDDAAEIVNATINATASSDPKPLTDLLGNEIQTNITGHWENAGLYGTAGGTLVEVKLERKDNPEESFWISGGMGVRLKLFFEAEYKGNRDMPINQDSVLISTWDPLAGNTGSGGAEGETRPIQSSGKDIIGTPNGARPDSMGNKMFSIASSASAGVSVSVMTPTGNMTYVPGNDATYPKLKAGSTNETFKLYFSNNLEEETFNSAQVYFILPQGEAWRASLLSTKTPKLISTEGFDSGDKYTIYYTTSPIDNEKIGNTAFYNNAELGGSNFTWTEMTFTGTSADSNIADDWEDITAIRVNMEGFEGSETLELHLPFELPPVSQPGVEYNQVAIGQTIYNLDYENEDEPDLSSESTYTGAVMLVESDAPVISAVPDSSSLIPEEFYTNVSVDYLAGGEIPTWYEFYTYDDFSDVEIRDVSIVFQPSVGTAEPAVIIPASEMTHALYQPYISDGSGGEEVDVDFSQGYKWTISDPENYVKTGVSGTYRIVYTTVPDDDSKISTETLTITMVKDPGTFSISAGDDELFWKTSFGSGVTYGEYFKKNVTVTDSDAVYTESARITLESSVPAFDINVPGKYKLTYNYTDIGGNTKNASMNVTVKYNGTLSGEVLGNGLPVEDFQLDINGADILTEADGTFAYDLAATLAAPLSVSYAIAFDSAVPAGLNYSGTLPISNSGSASRLAPEENIAFDAVSMGVTVTGETAAVSSVKLYESSNQEVSVAESADLLDTVFEKDAGWFPAGNYYFEAVLNPGYRLQTGGDIDGSSNKTVQFALGNVDITKAMIVEKAPMISGRVWNDVNGDSIIDAEETGISAASVALLDGSFTEIISTTATLADGSYNFNDVDLDEDLTYYVSVITPGGYNRVSALGNDQKIDAASNNSAAVAFTSEFHQTDINAGFYYAASGSGGGGTGGATVVDPSPTGDATVTDPMPGYEGDTDPMPGYTDPLPLVNIAWILLLVLLAIAVYCWEHRRESDLN